MLSNKRFVVKIEINKVLNWKSYDAIIRKHLLFEKQKYKLYQKFFKFFFILFFPVNNTGWIIKHIL